MEKTLDGARSRMNGKTLIQTTQVIGKESSTVEDTELQLRKLSNTPL